MSRPPHVMLAWEHGRNFGHAARLLAIADELRSQSATLTWAIPAKEIGAPWFEHTAGRFIACPAIKRARAPNVQSAQSFADILISLGFADPDCLQVAICAWLDLFESQSIDCVVLDYAPAAQLAAFIAGVPAAQITSGFEAPPPECPVFGIAMRGPMIDRRNRLKVEMISRCIASVCQRLGATDGASLGAVFAHPARWYDCITATDPYGPRTDGTYIGPIGKMPTTASIDWPSGPMTASKVFVYLRSEKQLATVLEVLNPQSYRVLCVLPGASEAQTGRLQRTGVTIATNPVDVDTVLPKADLVVTYGAITTVTKALVLGVHQIMVVDEVDKRLVADLVAATGSGRVLGGDFSAPELNQVLDDLTKVPRRSSAGERNALRQVQDVNALRRACASLLSNGVRRRRSVPVQLDIAWRSACERESCPRASP